jgi:protein gp37
MATRSAIEWTQVTWNPVTGCDRVAAGCDNCYALALAKRLKAMGVAKYQNDGNPETSGPGFGVTIHAKSLSQPYRWSGSRVVFVNSMSDLFHARVPMSFIREIFHVIRDTPQHTYQVLTKRAHRLERIADKLDWPEPVDGRIGRVRRQALDDLLQRGIALGILFVEQEEELGSCPA